MFSSSAGRRTRQIGKLGFSVTETVELCSTTAFILCLFLLISRLTPLTAPNIFFSPPFGVFNQDGNFSLAPPMDGKLTSNCVFHFNPLWKLCENFPTNHFSQKRSTRDMIYGSEFVCGIRSALGHWMKREIPTNKKLSIKILCVFSPHFSDTNTHGHRQLENRSFYVFSRCFSSILKAQMRLEAHIN